MNSDYHLGNRPPHPVEKLIYLIISQILATYWHLYAKHPFSEVVWHLLAVMTACIRLGMDS
jgi:hypothetical protein